MKNVMKFLLAAVCAVVLYSCGGDNDEPAPQPPTPSSIPDELVGGWKLTAWSDDVDGAISAGKMQVYLDLNKTNSVFTLYQNFNSPGFTKLTGTFVYNETSKSISGTYSGGVAWRNSYTISDLTSSSMKLTASGTGDIATYTKTTIPSDLVDGGTKAVLGAEDTFRFL